MSSSSDLINSIKAFKGHTTRYVNKAKDAITNNCNDLNTLQSILKNLEQKLDTVDEYQLQLLQALDAECKIADDDARQLIADQQADYIDSCTVYVYKLKDMIVQLGQSNSNSNVATSESFKFHLHKRSADIFTGSSVSLTMFNAVNSTTLISRSFYI